MNAAFADAPVTALRGGEGWGHLADFVRRDYLLHQGARCVALVPGESDADFPG